MLPAPPLHGFGFATGKSEAAPFLAFRSTAIVRVDDAVAGLACQIAHWTFPIAAQISSLLIASKGSGPHILRCPPYRTRLQVRDAG